MIVRFPVLALALFTMPGLGAAQEVFSLPSGCTAYASVQLRSCRVSHLFTCAGDPDGYQRSVTIDEEGLLYAGLIDAETQWIESEHVRIPASDRLEPGALDPASFSTLVATGYDDWQFQVRTLPDVLTKYEGFDRLTGNTLETDGILLEETEFSVVARTPEGGVLWRQSGNEYIQRDWGRFISGVRVTERNGEVYDSDNSPVNIDLPGDPGFLLRDPRVGCGATVSEYIEPGFPMFPGAEIYPAADILRTAAAGE